MTVTGPLRLTPLRAAVLCAVGTQRRPTLRSVAWAAGCSYGGARSALVWLESLGLVAREPHVPGMIRPRFVLVPVVKR